MVQDKNLNKFSRETNYIKQYTVNYFVLLVKW